MRKSNPYKKLNCPDKNYFNIKMFKRKFLPNIKNFNLGDTSTKIINNIVSYADGVKINKNNSSYYIFNNQYNKFKIMECKTLGMHDGATSINNIHHQHNRPIHLFTETNLDDNRLNTSESCRTPPSSEEDNSPTELNNCRRLIDKPPLVKRFTMGFLRSNEDSYPLVNNNNKNISQTDALTKNLSKTIILTDGYVNSSNSISNENLIKDKFDNSCRKSLTALPRHFNDDLNVFNLNNKKNLREICSANSSPKITSYNLKEQNNLTYDEQNDLKVAAWFQIGLPREISLEILSRKNPGAFLVRQSTTKPDCFALSLRVPPPGPKVSHYLILRTAKGYKIKGFTKEFTSLRALITHHSVMPELLPVPLTLPRPARLYHSSTRNKDDFDTYDSLNEVCREMTELNI